MRLLTMTPLHIGSGERLTPLSYVADKNILYVLDMNKFFSLLTDGQSEAYLQWMDPILNNLAGFDKGIDQAKKMLDQRKKKELQKQKGYEVEGLSIHRFIEKLLRQNPVGFAQKCTAYTIPCSSLPRRDGFKTHIKDCQNRGYIPGSEIKGALRTALLYKMLQNEQNYQILRNSLINLKNFRAKKKIEQLKKIAAAQDEHGLERCLLRGKEKDAKFDLLKFLRISDTSPAKAGNIKIEITRMLGTGKYTYTKTWIETIAPHAELSFDFSIKKNFSLDHLGLKEKENWLSPSSLLDALYYRTQDILQKEKSYFKGEKNILNVITMLEKENQPESPLLRLGAGQGFLGTTLNLIVLKNDPQLYDDAIRDGVSFYRRWRTQKNNFPKTRRVVIDPRDNALTNLGWVKLIPD